MLINKDQVNLIKENKICHIKDFVLLERQYDFNLISLLLEENDLKVASKSNIGNLKDIFQIYKVSNCLKEFKTFFDFLSKLFKYERDPRDEVDLFFSLASQVGSPHKDEEDVFIIALSGKIIYRIFDIKNKDYEMNKGDLIFIPKNIKHKVIGITPRIIASIGFYGKKD
jgi:mannose-6-phosphate isomerase-like protein (cupin superfamily)